VDAGDANSGAVNGGAGTSGAAFDSATPSRGANDGNVAVAATAGSGVPSADGVLVRRHLALSMVTEHYAKGVLNAKADAYYSPLEVKPA